MGEYSPSNSYFCNYYNLYVHLWFISVAEIVMVFYYTTFKFVNMKRYIFFLLMGFLFSLGTVVQASPDDIPQTKTEIATISQAVVAKDVTVSFQTDAAELQAWEPPDIHLVTVVPIFSILQKDIPDPGLLPFKRPPGESLSALLYYNIDPVPGYQQVFPFLRC